MAKPPDTITITLDNEARQEVREEIAKALGALAFSWEVGESGADAFNAVAAELRAEKPEPRKDCNTCQHQIVAMAGPCCAKFGVHLREVPTRDDNVAASRDCVSLNCCLWEPREQKPAEPEPIEVGSVWMEDLTRQAVCVLDNDRPMIALRRLGGRKHGVEMCCGQNRFHEEFTRLKFRREVPDD